jgi:O-antigen/teichoic acid export membrane protein
MATDGEGECSVNTRSAGIGEALRGGMAGSLAAGIAGQVVLVASGVLAARALGVEGRGDLAAIVLVPSILIQLGTLGMPLAMTYYVARDPEGSRTLLRRLWTPIWLQTILLTAAQVGLLWALVDDAQRKAALVSIPAMPALVAQQYGLAVLQGQARFASFNLLRIAPATAYTLGMLALAMSGEADLVQVVLAWTVANVLVGLALAAIAIVYAWHARADTEISLLRVIRFGTSAVLGSNSPVEVLRVDQAVVAVLLPRADLGLYVVALAFTSLPRFISQSVGMVAYPRVAATVRGEEIKRLLRAYLSTVAIAAGVVVGLLEVGMSWLIPTFFGPAFSGAVTTARILLIAAFLLALRRVLTDVAQGAGSPGAGTVAEIANLIVVLPLIVVVAPSRGIDGVATALTVGALVSLAVLAFMMRQTLRRTARLELPLVGASRADANEPDAVPLGRGES